MAVECVRWGVSRCGTGPEAGSRAPLGIAWISGPQVCKYVEKPEGGSIAPLSILGTASLGASRNLSIGPKAASMVTLSI